MQPARIEHRHQAPLAWSELPQGEWLAAEIQERLNLWCPRMFGYHLLKIGALSGRLSCASSPVRHQCTLAEAAERSGIAGLADQLPIRSGSIDVCLLAHTLDYAGDPHQVLREVERVLTDDGWAIVSGFNPHSLVGLGRLVPMLRGREPWRARMFSPERVQDWLHLLGFEVEQFEVFGFSRLCRGSRILWWRENLGRDYCRFLASVYVLAARKRRMPLTLLPQPGRLRPPLMVPGLARSQPG